MTNGPGAGRVVLIRHGATEWSAAGRHTGRTDVPLAEEGRRQAEALAEILAGWAFGRVLTSPLRRAAETCRLAGLGDRAEVRPDLVEWDYGGYEGKTTDEIRVDRPGWTLWSDGVPGGETADQVATRVDRIIDEVRRVPGDVAIFAHGHVLRVLGARWIGHAPAGGRSFLLDPATISVLGHERETPAIQRWNGACG